ncbi:U3 small nucleolar RNA-interacting protein 2 isoform X1 [Nematostella vectensis]|uniref:U3 small nucleolar RNA-interacting protein 2 isoform X1 n=1 Tax=Nematostella vectensis TaxID=45351 RepID=UPI002076F9B3|nr:U3 small nucleolar RNA-interacting protein 2 isoform X1 [Nematostella vectensis]
MSGFFLNEGKKTSTRKRPQKAQKDTKFKTKKAKETPAKKYDEELDSDSDIHSDYESGNASGSESDVSETAQEKKLRLTKEYLAQLEAEEKNKRDLEEIDHDAIAHRLQQDVLEQSGRVQRKIADQLSLSSTHTIRILRGHQQPVTCLCVSPDDKFVFTAAKDCTIIKWNVDSGKREFRIAGGPKLEAGSKGHKEQILALAITTDGKYLASGGKDKLIRIWDPDTSKHIHTFKGHRDVISDLAFRRGSHQLFSASHDKTVKIWNLDEMAYVETLFGHQDAVTGIDSLSRDRAATAGGRDRTLRIWKVVEESQLVFNGAGGSIDCIELINEDHFLSGSDDGSLTMWNTAKKKPLCTVDNADGKPSDSTTPDESWITALAAVKSTDLVASAGSCDSCVRLWQCGPGYRSIKPLFSVPVAGFVNALSFSSDGSMLFAGVGQEHRLGRWWRIKNAKNSLCIIPLERKPNENGTT